MRVIEKDGKKLYYCPFAKNDIPDGVVDPTFDAIGKPKPECPLRPGLFDPMSQNCSNPFTQNKNDPCRQNVSAGDFICIFGFRFGRRGIKPKKHEYKIKKHSLVSRIGNGNKKHQQCF